MKRSSLYALAVASLALGGCATYDYVGDTAPGGYYHGRPSTQYYDPYGGYYGGVGVYGGYGYGGYRGYYPYYGYYGPYYPIIRRIIIRARRDRATATNRRVAATGRPRGGTRPVAGVKAARSRWSPTVPARRCRRPASRGWVTAATGRRG